MRNELVILSRLKSKFVGKRILEIGVGGGRLTPALLEISKDYTGVDWSEKMTTRCRERFPNVNFMVCDARNLSKFKSESIDLIVFGLNGIDYVDHTGRIEALREIYRVLSDEGIFVFSSHNLKNIILKPWKEIQPWKTNPFLYPKSFLKLSVELLVSSINHIKNKKYEMHNDEFSILNDEAHDYNLLTYYISIDKQIHQLNEIGLNKIEVVDYHGNFLSDAEYTKCRHPWIYYICHRKKLI